MSRPSSSTPRVLLLLGPALLAGCPGPSAGADGGADDAGSDAPVLDALTLDAPGLDAAGLDAPGLDAPGSDAPGLDAPGLDAPGPDASGLDAPGLDAAGLDAPGLDAAGLDAPGLDAAGFDAPRLDAPGLDAPGLDAGAIVDAAAADTRADAGSRTDRCTRGCDYLLACGFSSCTSLGVDCAVATEEQACLADCLQEYPCIDVPGVGFSTCQSRCSPSADAGPPTDAGPGPSACTGCAMTSCSSSLGPCLDDATCSQLAFCLASCGDTTCRDDCMTRYPAAPAIRDPLLACVCSSCSAPCALIDPCAL